MHFEIRKCKIFLTQGGAALVPSPLSRALPLDPTRGPIGAIKADLDPTRGFLSFALDVSPSKQFLKVGSPVFSVVYFNLLIYVQTYKKTSFIGLLCGSVAFIPFRHSSDIPTHEETSQV